MIIQSTKMMIIEGLKDVAIGLFGMLITWFAPTVQLEVLPLVTDVSDTVNSIVQTLATISGLYLVAVKAMKGHLDLMDKIKKNK